MTTFVFDDDQERLTLSAIATHPRAIKLLGGKRTAARFWNWVINGHRGVKLPAIRSPRGWLTSIQALEHFLDELNADNPVAAASSAAHRAAEKALQLAGI